MSRSGTFNLIHKALGAATVRLQRRFKSSSAPESEYIDDYYSLLLSQPLSRTAPDTRTKSTAGNPHPTNYRESNIAKARVVFGSRLAGPAERRQELDAKSKLVAGMLVPPRPTEPDNCCMSGCVNCVWDIYRDDLEDWATKSKAARMKELQARGSESVQSMDDDGGGSETNWSLGEGEDLFAGVPVGIREFMRTEKMIKERHMKENRARA